MPGQRRSNRNESALPAFAAVGWFGLFFMCTEGIDVGECCVRYACCRMAIMQHLSHIVSALSHDLKPVLRNGTQFIRVLFHPSFDSRISLN